MSQLLLEGEVDNRDHVIASLEDDVSQLERELADARAEIAQVKRENARAIAALRKQLAPLYNALKMVFGEMNAIGGDDSPDTPTGKNAKWETVKQRLAPRLKEAVEILQMQGTMKRTQIASALKMDYSNCTKNVIGPLIRQGWVIDNGGNLSLKEL